ncbi:MAG TPA: amidohydrolase, partial [Gammaproteobacteria bacterium]|nr:amidohydrolase [Gammaproteobacteria bacterium]
KMATGILPVPEVLSAGINLGIGTDGALNNNGYDMFAEMKTACLLQNSSRRSAMALTPETVLEMATINGAKAIGRKDLGALETGKKADFILVDVNKLPLHNLISNLVFAINGSHVKDVYIDGNQVVDKGLVLGVNEELIYAKARDRAEDIRRLLNLTADTFWPMT